MSAAPIEAMAPVVNAAPAERAAAIGQVGSQSFGRLLFDGLQRVNQSVLHADHMARAFAVDDSVPLHQVTFALEQARLSVELMSQVRSRLVEGYQELFRMQL